MWRREFELASDESVFLMVICPLRKWGITYTCMSGKSRKGMLYVPQKTDALWVTEDGRW